MRVERPWGWYEDLLAAPGYKVKRLLIRRGRQLSLRIIVVALYNFLPGR